jgi:hypothetical protein
MVRVGSAQHKLVSVAKVNQAGIALGKLDHKRYDTVENLLEAHLPHHKTADLLEEPKLLLDPL